jgi:hypothetical protein
MRDNDLARRYPNLSKEDAIIQGAIDVYEERNWYRNGWNNGQDVCILESMNVSRYGKIKSSTWGIPKGVIERIHRAIYGEEYEGEYREHIGKPTKDELASEVMEWNDTGEDGKKKEVIGVLKRALALGKKEKE